MKAIFRHPVAVGVAVFVLLRALASPLIGPTVCRDGWQSHSIGARGACSHHGGVGTNWGALLATILSGAAGIWTGRAIHKRNETRRSQEMERRYPRPPVSLLPMCPQCGAAMRERLAKRGRHKGERFLGCSRYPRCKGTRPMDGDEESRTTPT